MPCTTKSLWRLSEASSQVLKAQHSWTHLRRGILFTWLAQLRLKAGPGAAVRNTQHSGGSGGQLQVGRHVVFTVENDMVSCGARSVGLLGRQGRNLVQAPEKGPTEP